MDTLTRSAMAASDRYRLFLNDISAIYRNRIEIGRAFSRSGLDQATIIAGVFLNQESSFIQDDVQRAAQMGRDDVLKRHAGNQTLESLDASQHVSMLADDLRETLHSQVNRDLQAFARALRLASFNRSLGNHGSDSDPAFSYVDRASRKWASHTLVKTSWRQILVFARIETAMLDMAKLGIKEFQIAHPSSDHRSNGIVIAPNELSIEDVRESVFHPNSEAFLIPRE